MRMNSLLSCLCNVVVLFVVLCSTCTVIYCTVLCCGCSLLLFCHYTSVRHCVVQFLQFWTLHFTPQFLSFCFCFLSLTTVLYSSLFLPSFEVFFWTFFFVISTSCIISAVCFDLDGLQLIQGQYGATNTLFPCGWEYGSKAVTAGTLSWQSEKYRFNNEHSILLLYSWYI